MLDPNLSLPGIKLPITNLFLLRFSLLKSHCSPDRRGKLVFPLSESSVNVLQPALFRAAFTDRLLPCYAHYHQDVFFILISKNNTT